MVRTAALQMAFPRFESDGVTHTGDCACPRCTVADEPSAKAAAAELQKARAALERMKEKKRVRALKMELALAESERQTVSLLEEQRQAYERVVHDEKLDELLRLRQAGLPPDEALAKVEEQRRPARRSQDPHGG